MNGLKSRKQAGVIFTLGMCGLGCLALGVGSLMSCQWICHTTVDCISSLGVMTAEVMADRIPIFVSAVVLALIPGLATVFLTLAYRLFRTDLKGGESPQLWTGTNSRSPWWRLPVFFTGFGLAAGLLALAPVPAPAHLGLAAGLGLLALGLGRGMLEPFERWLHAAV